MNPLRCQDIATAASPKLEGELGLWPRLWVRAHLLFCRNCRHHHAQIEQTVELTRAAGGGTLGAEVRRAVLERFRTGG